MSHGWCGKGSALPARWEAVAFPGAMLRDEEEQCYYLHGMSRYLGVRLSGFPEKFPELLATYCSQIADAIARKSHHDHRRSLLIDFLRKTFDIEVDEIELEKKVRAAEARGRIDAFYKSVIIEVKVDLDSERPDAVRELKKYFDSSYAYVSSLKPKPASKKK